MTKLLRIGRHSSGEPYFGRNGAYRFDDPEGKFGTCYCGEALDTAIAETILHDEIPEGGQFRIHSDEFADRYLLRFETGASEGVLRLANMTGAHLRRIGGDNALSAEHPYEVTQQWSAAVHAHPANVDGFVFVSRQINTKKAFVIFDRAKKKFGRASFMPLSRVRGLALAKKRLGILTVDH